MEVLIWSSTQQQVVLTCELQIRASKAPYVQPSCSLIVLAHAFLLVSQKVMPHVVEPALGVNRLLLAILCEGLHHELQAAEPAPPSGHDEAVFTEADGSMRPLLRLPAAVAPTTVAVFPLVKKGGLLEKANAFADALAAQAGIRVDVDASGSIGGYSANVQRVLSLLCHSSTSFVYRASVSPPR